MWNAHNDVFSLKRSAICAQAVYFLHSIRLSVTWLNSRWWLAACDWVMSMLFALLSTRVGRRRKFGEVSCTECTGKGNDFELISTVKMETRNPTEGHFGSEFSAICNHCGFMAAWSRKTLKCFDIFAVFGKTTHYGEIFKILFRKFSLPHRSTYCAQISWNLADWKSVNSRVAYLTKRKQNFAWFSSCRYCADHSQNLPGPVPDNVLRVIQTSSKSVHFRRSYIAERVNTVETRRKVNSLPYSAYITLNDHWP